MAFGAQALPRIIVIGSERQASQLASEIGDLTVRVIRESNDGRTPRDVGSIVGELQSSFEGEHGGSCICLGRGTVSGGIEVAASAWAVFSQNARRNLVWIGPTVSAAATFENKLTGLRELARRDLPVVSFCEQSDDIKSFPAVIKACKLTGGVGMRLVTTLEEAAASLAELASMHGAILFNELRTGLEVSIEALVLPGGVVQPMACVFKEECGRSLTHADWKVKIAVPLRAFPAGEALLLQFTRAFPEVLGYVSIESIVSSDSGIPEIIEVATRRTGNYALSMAVGIEQEVTGALTHALGLPVVKHVKGRNLPGGVGLGLALPMPATAFAEEEAEDLGEMVLSSVDVLGELPGSAGSERVQRLRLGFRALTDGTEEVEAVSRRFGQWALVDRHRLLINQMNDLSVTVGTRS